MASFRFIHSADIHLDSALKGLAGYEGSAAERIQTATREAFERLVGIAIEKEVSFVIIAGDLYDGDWRDYRTGLFFVGQVGRLAGAGIPLYLAHGNHDAESRITRSLTLPDNVNVFPSRQPGTFAIEELDVVLHGQSYKERDVSDNLVHAYPEPVPRRFNIGVLHTGLGGMGGHENYAPCSLEELVNKGYDYWALGHVHQYNLLNERPHVVFPGNLQGRNIRETGPKGAVLITVDDGELSDIEIIQTDVVRWALVSIDTGDTGDTGCCDRIEAIVERAGHAIERAVSSAGGDGRLLVCRLVIKGETELHGSLLASGDRLLAEARSAALGLGDGVAWIEKLVIDTVSPQAPAALFNREDALGQLRLMMARAHEEETLIAQVRADISQFVSKLPHEIRTGTEDPILSAAIKEDDNRLFEGAADYLTARLIEEEQ